MNYWCFLAVPEIYRVEEAVRSLDLDCWTTGGHAIDVGDRVLIWRALGARRRAKRGIVAFADVVEGPFERDDSGNPFWVNPEDGDKVEERVLVHYSLPAGLPIWMGSGHDELLSSLSVSRASGGTVFRVSPDQFRAVLELVSQIEHSAAAPLPNNNDLMWPLLRVLQELLEPISVAELDERVLEEDRSQQR